VNKLGRKVLLAAALFLMVAILTSPLVVANPWDKKNNEKFQSFSATFVFDPTYAQNLELQYKPSEDDPNIIIATWDENMLDYHITIDGYTYNLGTDFEHTGHVKRTAIGAPFIYSPFDVSGAPFGGKLTHSITEYLFDFSTVQGGIDGTLKMLSLWNIHGESFETSIFSLSGTGDLKNVQILATSGLMGHEGIVIGWPDIPPAIPP
jgi:hypothetical protein